MSSIIFKNNKGQTTPPKWMVDIRIPEDTTITTDTRPPLTPSSDIYYANLIYPRIELKSSLSSDVVSWQIVRSPLLEKDKSIGSKSDKNFNL